MGVDPPPAPISPQDQGIEPVNDDSPSAMTVAILTTNDFIARGHDASCRSYPQSDAAIQLLR
jgi:hypothetical protein